jgi:hypothetical protein
MMRAPIVIALCGVAVLHLGFDFLLHNDDGRAHFRPLRNWVFQSPVSYWDPDHYGNIAGAAEVALSLLCGGILWRRFMGLWMRSLIVLLDLIEFTPLVIFAFMFAGPKTQNAAPKDRVFDRFLTALFMRPGLLARLHSGVRFLRETERRMCGYLCQQNP